MWIPNRDFYVKRGTFRWFGECPFFFHRFRAYTSVLVFLRYLLPKLPGSFILLFVPEHTRDVASETVYTYVHAPTARRPRTSRTPRRGSPPRTCTRPARTSRGRSRACAAGRWPGRPRDRSHARRAARGSAGVRCSLRPPTLCGRCSAAPCWPGRGARRRPWRWP